MSITLLTAVPGGGKTSYAVWEVIREAHKKGQIIYTVGIPKLTIPTIELSYEDIRSWNVLAPESTASNPILATIELNSIIVIDEVQKIWPATGSKITDDIKDLSVHRHYGLSFFIITQSPNLIHRNVLSLVDRHLHIGVKWSGRKLYEWPEYCRSPSAKSSKDVAVASSYKLPSESFKLYHSATAHVKPKKAIPASFYIFIVGIVATIVLGYYGSQRILSKSESHQMPEGMVSHTEDKKIDSSPVPVSSPPIVSAQPAKPIFTDISMLSKDVDWTKISACMSSKSYGCVCYGTSAERVMIPKETCEAAVQFGWSRQKAM